MLAPPPSLIYAGATDGGLAGCAPSTSDDSTNHVKNGSLALEVLALDVSTGDDTCNGPLLRYFSVDRVDNGNQKEHVEIFVRNRARQSTGSICGYDPGKRSWFAEQLDMPDSARWTDLYVFASRNHGLGITATKGFNFARFKDTQWKRPRTK